jgi:transcriptional regulator with XRE-family HTH domain
MMDLSFRKPGEIVKLLCQRLRKERLSRQMTQADVAARAGLGVNTVSNLEAGRSVAFESVIRVAKLRQTGASVAAIHAKNRANGAVGSVDRAGVCSV